MTTIISLHYSIPTPNTQVVIPLYGTDLVVSTNWGDGTDATLDHTYSAIGEYDVVVTLAVGSYNSFGVTDEDAIGIQYLTSVTSWGPDFTSLSMGFSGATSLTSVPPSLPASVTDLSYMFVGATSFNSPLNTWNTSLVTNMIGMFQHANAFDSSINFDTSSVTNMRGMFADANSFDSSLNFDTSSVTDMSYMFSGAGAFNQPLNFDTSIVTNMSGMFSGAGAFNQPLTFNTSSVIYMGYMFYGASVFNQDIGGWDVSSVVVVTRRPHTYSMTEMLDNCGLDVTNYDRLLNGWITVNSGIHLGAVGLHYSLTGQNGRNFLTGPPNNWIITGDSLAPTPPIPPPPSISIPSQQPSGVTPYPSNQLHRAGYFKTMFDTTLLPYNKMYNNCSNTLCYNYSKNYIYKPHSAYGMVGTSAAAYRGRRKRL
jgi:surface protein